MLQWQFYAVIYIMSCYSSSLTVWYLWWAVTVAVWQCDVCNALLHWQCDVWWAVTVEVDSVIYSGSWQCDVVTDLGYRAQKGACVVNQAWSQFAGDATCQWHSLPDCCPWPDKHTVPSSTLLIASYLTFSIASSQPSSSLVLHCHWTQYVTCNWLVTDWCRVTSLFISVFTL